jgi:CheY-like chemotaxis protein
LPWTDSDARVPGAEKVAIEPPVRAGATLPARPITVLLVDDNEASLDMMSEYLQDKGYRVILARNGREAVQRAREDRPDLILMDVQMPGMDGLEAIRHIRSDSGPGEAGVPIIALTALAMPGDRERCIEAGANGYLSKPVSPKGLIDVIQMQLAGRGSGN